jgi:hypothetical protein
VNIKEKALETCLAALPRNSNRTSDKIIKPVSVVAYSFAKGWKQLRVMSGHVYILLGEGRLCQNHKWERQHIDKENTTN